VYFHRHRGSLVEFLSVHFPGLAQLPARYHQSPAGESGVDSKAVLAGLALALTGLTYLKLFQGDFSALSNGDDMGMWRWAAASWPRLRADPGSR
jgi:hypothetical protein